MKPKYYVNDNAQPNGDHEVHIESCIYYSRMINKTDLGEHDSCQSAVLVAKKKHRQVNGCVYCCLPCHTS
jgi:hypothetical protein